MTPAISAPSMATAARIAMAIARPVLEFDSSFGHSAPGGVPEILIFIPFYS
jgi:hypothetical protein